MTCLYGLVAGEYSVFLNEAYYANRTLGPMLSITFILLMNLIAFSIIIAMVEDAYEIADRIAILKDGELIQIDTPDNLYNNPVNDYVAGFTGHYSYFENQRLRPEEIVIDTSGSHQGLLIKKTFNGADYEIELKCNTVVLIANLSIDSDKNVGDYLNFSLNKR